MRSRTISSVRAEIKNRAFSSNAGLRRYRHRGSVDSKRQTEVDQLVTTSPPVSEPKTQPSSTAAGQWLAEKLSLSVSF